MKFPVDERYEFDYKDDDNFYRGISPKMLAMFMEDEKNRENKVAPDTFGADKYFIDGFVTEEMEYDFGIIAREFMKHHFGRLKEFNDLAVYGNDKPEQSNPEKSIQNKVLNIMYNAAKSGDRYSVEMMKFI